MRKIELDFQRRPGPSVSGWLLMLGAVAAIGGVVHVRQLLAHDSELQVARLARLQTTGMAVASAPADAADDPTVVAARQALDKSRLPWNALFSALESADGADVALLAIAPDVTRRQVKIQAEARNLNAMLAFHQHLQQQPTLTHAVLVEHTIAKDKPDTPVRFQIIATWGANNVSP